MRTYLGIAVLALALSACGTGSGGGNATPPPSTPTPSPMPTPTSTLGSRAMPGSAVTVTPETAISAGQPASMLISAPDLPAGATLSAAVGVDYDTAAAATITALPANQWRAALTLPSPLPAGTCVLVTVTLADGSVLESGREDFVLAR